MKHAYLIVAHHQFEILMKTLKILDDVQNDFFIHIDSKANDVPFEEIEQCCAESHVYFSERTSVHWGGYSQINCTYILLELATQTGQYDYFHLLSGVDLPIKPKTYILDYFEENRGKQFVHFESSTINPTYLERIKLFSFFTETGNKHFLFIDKILRRLQKYLRINRIKDLDITFQYGSNWFSITKEFAEYVLSKRDWIKAHYTKSICADELFIQTLLVNSPFIDQLTETSFTNDYMSCLRLVDWERGNNKGNPYIFRISDLNELLSSPCLFARKFDENVDNIIIETLYKRLSE